MAPKRPKSTCPPGFSADFSADLNDVLAKKAGPRAPATLRSAVRQAADDLGIGQPSTSVECESLYDAKWSTVVRVTARF